MNRTKFYKWVDQFKSGLTCATRVQCVGRSIEVSTAAVESLITKLVQGVKNIYMKKSLKLSTFFLFMTN